MLRANLISCKLLYKVIAYKDYKSFILIHTEYLLIIDTYSLDRNIFMNQRCERFKVTLRDKLPLIKC